MTIKPPIDVTIQIAPGADLTPGSLGFTGAAEYEDISAYRRQSAPIEIEYGRDDEASSVEAGSGSMTLDVRDGRLVPYNPESDLYGVLAQNVPVRVKLPNAWQDTFDRPASVDTWGTSTSGHTWIDNNRFDTNGTAGTVTMSTANTATIGRLSGGGSPDVEIRLGVRIDRRPQVAACVAAAVLRYLDVNNYMAIYINFQPDGTVRTELRSTVDGVNTLLFGHDTTEVYNGGDLINLRGQAEGGVYRSRVWVGDRVTDEPPLHWDIEEVAIETDGADIGVLVWRLAGEVAPGSRVFTFDYYEVDALLLAGNIPDLPPSWDKSGKDAYATVELAGAMRLLGQMTDDEIIRSPVYRQLSGYLTDPKVGGTGMWSIEDASGSVAAASAVPGSAPATGNGVSFGNSDAPPGIEASAQYTEDTASFSARAKTAAPQNWCSLIFLKLPTATVTSDTVLCEWQCDTGTVRRWRMIYTPAGSFKVQGATASGTEWFTSTAFNAVINVTNWFAAQVMVTLSGGIISWRLEWYEVGVNQFWFFGSTLAGTLGGVRGLQMKATAELNGMAFAMVWMGSSKLPFVTNSFVQVSNGYPGEAAADRIARICNEEGVPVAIRPGFSTALGTQKAGKFFDILREAEAADQGVLHERGRGLGYIPYGGRINRDITLDLSWSGDENPVEGGDLAEAPAPSGDDQRYVSQWTVRRTGGSEYTYQAKSDLTDDIVRRRGLKKAGDEFSLNADTQLPDHASWRTMMGTWPELRFPRIVLDLVAHPELIDSWLKCRIGSRIRISNPKSQVVGSEIELIIEGVQQTIGRHEWKVTLSCSPARMWDVAVYDNTARRCESRTASLDFHAYSASATSLNVWVEDFAHRWSTTATPYDWMIAGERVRVTAMTAAVDLGSGYWEQTATVQRSINGVSKALDPFAKIRMHPSQQARYARR